MLSPDDADQIAERHFTASCPPSAAGMYRVARQALLPHQQKIYYQIRCALARPRTDEDGVLAGDGGFFVSLTSGAIEVVGSGAWVCADWYLRARHHLKAEDEPPSEELAELLATHSAAAVFQMWHALPRS